jgi:hypothetical protein
MNMKIGVLLLLVIFLTSCADFLAGGTACGRGKLESWQSGFGGRSRQVQTNEINDSLPCEINLPGGGIGTSTTDPVSSTKILYGEGTVSAFVKKNGIICDQQTKSGKGILRVYAECR